MIRKNWHYVLFFLLCIDIGYSFFQHWSINIDGDMAKGVLQAREARYVFDDPFGISVITKGAVYPNPNRFFSQWINSKYFQTTPLFLQRFMNPIDSIYFSCGLIKTLIQVALIYLLTFFVSKSRNIFSKEFLVITALIFPLFQTNGYRSYMGIIDQAVTYNFFYSLPMVFLLVFYLPFFKSYFEEKEFKLKLWTKLLFIPLMVVVTLSGPLNTGVVLIVSLLVFVHFFGKGFLGNNSNSFFQKVVNGFSHIPKQYIYYFIPISLLSLYSLYLGSFNSLSTNWEMPMMERFSRLPMGIYFQFTQKLGFPILFLFIGMNAFLIRKKRKEREAKKILNILNWIIAFSIIYILLLPFGGVRVYRPNILRYDTILPITLSLVFFYALSSYYLIRNISKKNKIWYVGLLVLFALVFTISDEPDVGRNYCEREALNTIANSKEKIVFLKTDCTIMEYRKIIDPKDSELNGELLYLWGVTKEKKTYYQE